VLKRLQRLDADGVITRRVALINPEKVGSASPVRLDRNGDHSQDWLAKCERHGMPEVMEFYRMAGDVDYMLRVVVHDMPGTTRSQEVDRHRALTNVTSRFAMERDQVDDRAADCLGQSGFKCTVSGVG